MHLVKRVFISAILIIVFIGLVFILERMRPTQLLTEKQVKSGLKSGEFTAYLVDYDNIYVSEYKIKVSGLIVCDSDLKLIAMQDGDSIFISNDQNWIMNRKHLIKLGATK